MDDLTTFFEKVHAIECKGNRQGWTIETINELLQAIRALEEAVMRKEAPKK